MNAVAPPMGHTWMVAVSIDDGAHRRVREGLQGRMSGLPKVALCFASLIMPYYRDYVQLKAKFDMALEESIGE